MAKAQSAAKLTLEDLQQLLALPTVDEELHPYLDAASVLAAFDPLQLTPVGEAAPPRQVALEVLLPLCEPITEGTHRGLWTLSLADRRSALRRLGTRQRMRRALRANPDRPDTPLQRMFVRVVDRAPLQLDELSRDELAALFTVNDWIGDILREVPDEASLRRALTTHDLTAPMRRLTSGGFVDRRNELRQLEKYVSTERTRPLFVFGPGGVGKSTLIARFLLEQLERDDTTFAYVDIDRPRIQPERPLTVLLEVVTQLHSQLGVPDRTGLLAEQIAESIGREDDTRQFETFQSGAVEWMLRLGEVLAQASSGRTIIVVDTFEEAQFLGPEVAWPLVQFLLELARSASTVHVMLSGRSLPPDYLVIVFPDAIVSGGEGVVGDEPTLAAIRQPERPIDLEVLELAPARELLERSLELEGQPPLVRRDLDDVIAIVSRNPMCLKLAARLLREEGVHKLRSARSEVLTRLRAEKIQALLYGRILHHIHDDDVRAIAYPGLIVRRIDPDVIRNVLAEPCKLQLTVEHDEHQIFYDLQREAALVELDPEDGSLRHRLDVRRAMLEDLTDHVDQAVVDQIDRAAVAYYEGRTGPIARAEEIYHRLRRREPSTLLDARWMPEAGSRLKNVGDEVGAEQQLWLAEKLGRTLDDPSLRETASQEAWEAQARRAADRFLLSRLPEKALDILHERSQRLPRSELYALEAEGYRFLGRHDDALEVARAGVESASRAGAIDMALDLLLKMVVIEEGRDSFEAAHALADEAAAVASHTSNEYLELRTLVTRLRVDRHLRPEAHESRQPVRFEALEMLTPEMLSELRTRPVLLREVAAELGKDHAQLASSAIEILGLEVASDEQAQALGHALATLNADPPSERRQSPAVIKGIERFEKSEFDPVVIEEWVTKNMTTRDTQVISGSVGATEPRTKVLGDFREYFRAGVENSIRGV
ncbi:MAG TPA: ATP-binding protein [Gaiella sp.]|uniref:ATP-binding protein n=1 Tax=Gaiella sp. TaxID=2663207 RepID=UPI002D7F07EA|nr:ATP-binding protein [Gaiella sp.]HET9287137.1 ATP-binding protein [Gaiella sp.]